MKQVHIKQKLIASAIVGALMIPGSAMVVDATDTDENVNVVSQVAGINQVTVATVTADVLNVRAGQGTDFQILLQILEQERYEVTGDSVNGWYPITVGDVDGWVSGEWITTEKVDKEEFAEEEKQAQMGSEETAQETVALQSSSYTTGQQVIDFACQFIGNPYVWGGTSLTNGADCSGFVKSVYKSFGYNLPRSSSSQRSAGRKVSYSNKQPGDLICYSGHIAIYIGNGKIVHASSRKTGIKISPKANYRKVLSVRRIVK